MVIRVLVIWFYLAWFWPHVGWSATGRPGVPETIAVELKSMPKEAFVRFRMMSFHRKLLVRLVQSDFAVVGEQQVSQLRVRFVVSGSLCRVVVKGGSLQVERTIARSDKMGMSQIHLEMLHKVVSAAREVRWKLRKQQPRPALPKPDKQSKGKPQKVPLVWRGEFGLDGGALSRVDGVDLVLRLGGRLGPSQGIGLWVSLLFSPSVAPPLTITEWGLQAGPSWRQRVLPNLSVELGLLLGVGVHVYFVNIGIEEIGVRWDMLGHLMGMLNWQLHPRFGLRLWASAGFTLSSRVHQDEDRVYWQRSFLRFEGGVGFYFVL